LGLEFPAAYDGVLSVGASELDDSASPGNPSSAVERVAPYSNSGPNLSLVAPGGNVTAADASVTGTPDYLHWISNLYTTTPLDPSQACATPGDCKAMYVGTSQAAPHVAGAAALVLSVNPNLTGQQVSGILTSTADDIGDPNEGAGRLDVYRAVASAAGLSPVGPPSLTAFRAIAFVPNGSNAPHVLNVDYPRGVPVAANGTFRIADVPASVSSYSIGLWYDANGDGIVDTGDWWAQSGPCTAGSACSASGLIARPVKAGFVLSAE
jgi:subtilisin family serine protease